MNELEQLLHDADKDQIPYCVMRIYLLFFWHDQMKPMTQKLNVSGANLYIKSKTGRVGGGREILSFY